MRQQTEPARLLHPGPVSGDEQDSGSSADPALGDHDGIQPAGNRARHDGERRRSKRRRRVSRTHGFRCIDGRTVAEVTEEIERLQQLSSMYIAIHILVLGRFKTLKGTPAEGLINTRHGTRAPDSEIVRIVLTELSERQEAYQRRALELYDPEQLAVLDDMNGDDDDDFA